jgi:hypothetical protein
LAGSGCEVLLDEDGLGLDVALLVEASALPFVEEE